MTWAKLLADGLRKIFFPNKIRKPTKTVAQAVRSDWFKIGKDFRKVINNYGGR